MSKIAFLEGGTSENIDGVTGHLDNPQNQGYHDEERDPNQHMAEVKRRLQNIRLIKKIDDNFDEEALEPVPHTSGEKVCLFILNFLFGCILLPIYLCVCWVIVGPNQACIVTSFGKIRKVITEPGCHYNPLLTQNYVSTKVETLQIKGSSVPDLKGSPMNVSVIINFKIVNPIRAIYAVDNYKDYLEN